MVSDPDGADVRDRVDVERSRQVDTGHACAARLTAWGDSERHGEDAAPIAARGQWSGRTPRKIAEPMRSARHGFGSSASRHLCGPNLRSEEHTSELQSLMRISYAVFCLKKKKIKCITLKTYAKQDTHSYSLPRHNKINDNT